MKEIQEFAQLSAWEPMQGDQRRLYDMALTGISRKEAKAAFELSESHFNVLYKKLKEQMARGVLDSEMEGYSRTQKLKFDVRRQYETAMVMLQTGHMVAGIPLARATMKKAEKLALFQVAMDLCRELLRHYSTVEADEVRHEQYFNKLWYYWREIQNELQAECIFFDFVFKLKKDLLTEGIEDQMEELAKVPSKSYRFHYMRFLTKVIYFQAAGLEEEMIKTCLQSLKFFNEYEDLPYVVKFSFVFRLIPYYLVRSQYEEAEAIINESLDGPAYGRYNWQIIMYYQALLGLHSGNKDLALETYQEAVRVPKKYRSKEMVTRWKVIRAYLELLDVETRKTWNLDQFLKELKENQNVNHEEWFSLRLVELLHHLKNKRFDKFNERLKSFEEFLKPYLNRGHQNRYFHLLKLFKSLVESGFDAEKAKVLGNEYYQAFQHSKRYISTDIEQCEVIPFERLWLNILRWLK